MTLSTVVTGTRLRSDALKVTRHLDAARSALDAAAWQLATETSELTGYTWHASDHAPNTYDSLVCDYYASGLTDRSLPVWSGGSDRTLYGSAGHNYAFRFWHDMGHIAYDLSFTFGDERRDWTARRHSQGDRMNAHAFALAVATQTCIHGGMTVSVQTGLEPARGYAIASGSKEVSAWSGTEVAAGRIARFLRSHRSALAKPGNYLGTWLYGGRLYLGVAEVVDTADTAITLARESGQHAVHDISRHADIFVREAV